MTSNVDRSKEPLLLTREAARALRLFGAEDLAEIVEHIDAENVRLIDALREIAGYEGDDSEFDYTAAAMRRCAREALK